MGGGHLGDGRGQGGPHFPHPAALPSAHLLWFPGPASEAPELCDFSSPCSLGVTQLAELGVWLFISSR